MTESPSDPQASVLVLAYNQERYLAQTLGSVLMQRTAFRYEVVIGEDHSSDGTLAVAEDFERRYPETVRVLRRSSNLGMVENFLDTLRSCKSDLIALVEGDDFWIDPNKLQAQVDFMTNHPAHTMCFTNNFYWDEWNSHFTQYKRDPSNSQTLTPEDFIEGYPCGTCVIMLRRSAVSDLPDWLHQVKALDWPLTFLFSLAGPVGFLPIMAGVYRRHSESLWSPKPFEQKMADTIPTLKLMDQHTGGAYSAQFQRTITRHYVSAIEHLLKEGRVEEARTWYLDSLKHAPDHQQPNSERFAQYSELLGSSVESGSEQLTASDTRTDKPRIWDRLVSRIRPKDGT